MDSFVAAIAFLLTTGLGAGVTVSLTYATAGVAPVGYTLLGTKSVASGFLAGYYKILIAEAGPSSPSNDFKGYWLVA